MSPLKIYTAGATREGIGALAEAIERTLGFAIETPTNHGHLITEHVEAGATDADVVMLTTDMIDRLTRAGLVDCAISAPLGTIGIGAAVRTGSPVPDVSSMKGVITALMAAPSVLITEAPSGVHLERVFAEMGLAAMLAPKLTRFDTGTMVNEHLVAGTVEDEIAFGVATEILFFRNKGVIYAGPLPDAIQMKNDYAAAMLTRSIRRGDAKALMDFLMKKKSRDAFAETGIAF